MKKLIEWAWGDPTMKIVRVKSWKGWWGPYGFEWPVLLVDHKGGYRSTSSLVWNWEWLRGRIYKS